MKIINKKYLVFFVSILLSLLLVTCTENHLLPKFGTITITSNPEGAEVILNNKNKGITPLTIKELVSGDYTIELLRNEFVDTTISVSINENQNADFNVYLIEEDPKGIIELSSKPSGADIFLNDQNTAHQTPHTFSSLKRGTYDFALKLNLYDDANFSVDLEKDESISKNTRLAIAGSSGGLIISSNPSGAQVFVDDFNTGFTPDTLNPIAPGIYSIKLTLDEFKDTSFAVSVEEGQNKERSIILVEAAPKGIIKLTSNPSGADIFLNNVNTNQKTPYTFSNMERGDYDFTLKLNLYDDANFSVNLSKDESVEKNTNLAIAGTSGGLTINSTPSGATLYIDDINSGVTPHTVNPIAPGNYSVKLSLDEYKDTSFTATVSAGNTNTFDVLLKGLFLIDVAVDPEVGGTIAGAGGYTEGESVTLIATPNTGYNFVNWKEGNTIITTNTALSFITTGDRNLTATFELKEYQIEATTNPESAGNISGTGTYKHGESVELSFTANDGYEFINWTENDNQVSTNEVYSFTATGNRSLVANFKELGNLTINSDPEGASIYLNGTNTGQVTPHEFTNLDIGEYTVELKLEHFADISRDITISTNETTDLGTLVMTDITPDVNVEITSNINNNGQLAFYFDFNQDVKIEYFYVTTPGVNGETRLITYVQQILEDQLGNWNWSQKESGNWKFIFTGTKVNGREAEFEVTDFVQVD